MKDNSRKKEERIKVKVCGVKSLETAYNLYLIGVDLIGLHLWKSFSQERLEEMIEKYREIALYSPAGLSLVLVTDIFQLDIIFNIIENIKYIDIVQFTGEINAQSFKTFSKNLIDVYNEIRIYKTCPFNVSKEYINEIKKYVNGIVFDYSWLGGTGKSYYYYLLEPMLRWVKDELKMEVFIAGGVNIDNVCQIVSLEPTGVDIESFTEDKLRSKEDPNRIIKVKNMLRIAELIKTISRCSA